MALVQAELRTSGWVVKGMWDPPVSQGALEEEQVGEVEVFSVSTPAHPQVWTRLC